MEKGTELIPPEGLPLDADHLAQRLNRIWVRGLGE